MAHYILALDQGTTSSRAFVYDQGGDIVCMEKRELPQMFPKPGWVEHDPDAILKTQLIAAKAAIKSLGNNAKDIFAIGITNQRETTLLWEKATGKTVCNAIVWQCRRSAEICEELKRRGLGQLIHKKTGLVIDAYFSASKLLWIFNEYPELLKRAKNGDLLFGTVDTWLLYNLTGKHLTDYTNASRTMLFNIENLAWDGEVLSLLGIPESILPEVLPSGAYFGETKRDLFGRPIPVRAVAGDQQAALFGQGCFGKGMVKNTYGTGCFILMHTGELPSYSKNGLLTTCACEVEGYRAYALEGSVFIGGAVVQWLRDNLGIIENPMETEHIANSLRDNDGVYFVPAFVGLGAPYWNMKCTGTITGLTRGASKEHIVRASLESIAYQCHTVVKCMERDSGLQLKKIRVDGGASKNNFLMQFQSDILDANIQRPFNIESTSKGVFYLAGLGSGIYDSKKDIEKELDIEKEFCPNIDNAERRKFLNGWERAVQRTIWVDK